MNRMLIIVCLMALVAHSTSAVQAQTPDLTGGGLVTLQSHAETQQRFEDAKRRVEMAAGAKLDAELQVSQARTTLTQARVGSQRLAEAVTEVEPLVTAFVEADRAVGMARTALSAAPTDATLKSALEEADGKLRTARGALKGFIRGLNAEAGCSIDPEVEPLLTKDAVQKALDDKRVEVGKLAEALESAQAKVTEAATFLTGAEAEFAKAETRFKESLNLVGNLYLRAAWMK